MGAEEYLKSKLEKAESRRLLDSHQEKRLLKMILDYQKSDQYKKFQKREAIQNIALIFDPKAKISRIIAKATRKHQ